VLLYLIRANNALTPSTAALAVRRGTASLTSLRRNALKKLCVQSGPTLRSKANGYDTELR
jgi:hypothetical protein